MITIPNLLSGLRILLIPFFVAASMRGQFDLAFGLFVLAAITDVLDGYLARRLNQRSILGAVLDPAADKMLSVSGFLVYTLVPISGQPIPAWLTFTIFLRDFLIAIFAYVVYTRLRIRHFPPSAAGKLATGLQSVTLAAAIAANHTVLSPVALLLLDPLLLLTLAATLISGFDYLRRAGRLLDTASEHES